ncbi:MAG: twin-arginine translocation signal domain-containing protein [Candidatus Acidiferrales bacterium]
MNTRSRRTFLDHCGKTAALAALGILVRPPARAPGLPLAQHPFGLGRQLGVAPRGCVW